jgi:small-conductance mechanosensitive channel
MLDNLTANAINAFLPNLTYTLPWIGEYDFTKIVSAGLVFVGLTVLFWFVRTVFLIRAKALAQKTTGTFDDALVEAVENIKAWVYTVVAMFAALQFFTLPETVDLIIKGIFYFVIVWQAIAIATCFIDYFVQRYLEKDEDGDGIVDPGSATASNMVTLIARIVMWVLGIIFVLSNLGIEVTSLIAGLGVGGIAVAFALQGVLGDLFASFSLYFDKPFRIGDFIVIGDDSGTVEKIGVKTTRIRTLQGEELVVSNTELTTARVQNFKKMDERRIVSQFGITYETPQEKVQEVPEIVKNIFEGIEGARLDRVHFTTFADSALIFELVYHVETADYAEYLDKQQTFNFELMRILAEKGVEFAYPTQTIYTKTVS